MNSESNEERKIWLDFIKELKISYLNKINSSAIKIGSLFGFLGATIVLFLNALPNQKPNGIKIYYLLIVVCFLMSSSTIIFNIFNSHFRSEIITENILGNYNELKKQYMKPIIIESIIWNIFWFIFNLIVIIQMFIYKMSYYYLAIPCFIFAILSFSMFCSSLLPVIKNYWGFEVPKIEAKNNKGLITNYLLLILSIYSLCLLYFSGFIFEYKRICLYALYIFGILSSFSYIARYLSYKIIYAWIETLYKEVHIKCTSAEEIRKIITNNIELGENLNTITYNCKVNIFKKQIILDGDDIT